MSEIESKASEIWDRWRRNEISHEEVQLELDKILGSNPKGFFVKLGTNLRGLINQQFPDKTKEALHVNEYFERRDKAREKLITSTNWASYWQFNSNMLNAPSSDETEHLKQMSNHELIDYFKLVCLSLKQLVNNNLERSEQARILHAYYLMIKNQINSRDMCKLPKTDAFLEYVQHKKHYKDELEKIERCRELGICPKCESKENVISYGDKWKCTSCNSYFRKH